MIRRLISRASSPVRSLVGSTAIHGTMLGAAVLFGLRLAVVRPAGPAPQPRIYSFIAETDLFEPAPELEELFEPEFEQEQLPEPELTPVEYESEAFEYHQTNLDELPDELPAIDTLPLVDLAPPPPELQVIPEPAPPPPELQIVVVERLPAMLIEGRDPSYPPISIRLRESGSVLCVLQIGADGRVSRVEIEESSGHVRLDRAAVECLRDWRFRPSTLGGEVVHGTYRHRVRFELEA